MRLAFLLLFLCLLSTASRADLVKPALIEINVEASGAIHIELRASIEALLTGINGRYKNTKEAPNAAEYDRFRALQSEQLALPFERFKASLLEQITLTNQAGKAITLRVRRVDIPERGYIKVPRISLIQLEGTLPPDSQSLQWYYPLSFGDYAVRLRQIDKEKSLWHWSEWQWIRKNHASEAFVLHKIAQKKSLISVVKHYIGLGFMHIFPQGMDHILFILALFFFSTQLKPLLLQITMFTLAHTLTLGLSVTGIISLPQTIVQPLIALSIAYAGFENVFAKGLYNSRLGLIFIFGLLHGIGFASALDDFGMPTDAFMIALISFNIGVELGQLAIILGAFLGLSLWFYQRPWYRVRVIIPLSLLIAFTGLYWTLDRLELTNL